ncbi:MAG: zf-HC2 domain-containing protein [Planctomycetes bacterium]|nr:zf-HC2 domain-containing protein [Planctomycetota bacterium]
MIAIESCKDLARRVPAYVEGSASADERLAIEDHLRGCPGCRKVVERFGEVEGILRGAYGGQALSSDFNEKTGQRMHAISTGALPPLDLEYDELPPAPAPGFFDRLQQSMGAAPWWIISGAFHALLILLVFLIGMVVMQAKSQDLVIVTNLEKQEKPPEPEKKLERDVLEKPVVVQETDVVSEQTPIVTHEVVEFAEQVETDNDSDAHDTKGEDGLSDVWLGGNGTVGSLGVGGGGRAGAFGRPNGAGGRLKRAVAGGGGKATESAVDAALAWLARHQEADGHWDYKKYGGGGKVWDDGSAEGISAIALLAFLGAGHTERTGKHKENVKRALGWIISKQNADGGFGGPKNRNGQEYEKYDVALCTLALCEAFAMARNPEVGKAAQRGVEWIVKDQDYNDGTWHHGPWKSTSLIGWNVMAMKSAKVAGLGTDPACFEKAIAALERVTGKPDANAAGAAASFNDGKQLGKVLYSPTVAHCAHQGETMTAVGMVCYQFFGRGEETKWQAEFIAQQPPAWPPTNNLGGSPQTSYHWYYGTLGLFQNGGEPWKRWNEALKNALVPNQRKGGPLDGSLQDVDGSWDPDDVWCKIGGRVYQTAMCALCLEVYYRYLPMYR